MGRDSIVIETQSHNVIGLLHCLQADLLHLAANSGPIRDVGNGGDTRETSIIADDTRC